MHLLPSSASCPSLSAISKKPVSKRGISISKSSMSFFSCQFNVMDGFFVFFSPGAGDIPVRQQSEDTATNSGAAYQDAFVKLLRAHFPARRLVVSLVCVSTLLSTECAFACLCFLFFFLLVACPPPRSSRWRPRMCQNTPSKLLSASCFNYMGTGDPPSP